MKRFDRKFGKEYLASVPDGPGVYRFFDESGVVIYVGKAKRLRRRLAQYRNAGRLKRDRKMKKIVLRAASVDWESCETDLDACLREIRLIQELRPAVNVAGKFWAGYPLLGIAPEGADRVSRFAFTTAPAGMAGGFRLFGAFRSREITAEAFFALMRLLRFFGHPAASGPKVARTYVFAFRRLDGRWLDRWDAFFRGVSREAVEDLSLALVDKPGARAKAADIEDDLRSLARFWAEEAAPLADVILRTGFDAYPVPQAERDPLFLRARADVTSPEEPGSSAPA